jgi:hypothetical protein
MANTDTAPGLLTRAPLNCGNPHRAQHHNLTAATRPGHNTPWFSRGLTLGCDRPRHPRMKPGFCKNQYRNSGDALGRGVLGARDGAAAGPGVHAPSPWPTSQGGEKVAPFSPRGFSPVDSGFRGFHFPF